MTLHAAGIVGLVVIFVIGTLRPINLGALALVATWIVGVFVAKAPVSELLGGFPVELLILLVGVTYLFGIASNNGTVARIVDGAAAAIAGRRALIPWMVFVVASLPAMAGALGSAGVAMIAPLSLRLAERYEIDRRMIGLMVVHGAAAGNFSPLNVLSAVVSQALTTFGVPMPVMPLFIANLIYNVALAVVIFIVFGGLRLGLKTRATVPSDGPPMNRDPASVRWHEHAVTLVALVAVPVLAFRFGLNVGFVALSAAVLLHLIFPTSSAGADRHIAWGVVLLVCGIVTYVAALQRFGTMTAVGESIAALGSPLMTALLLCAVAAVTSAFASSAGILGATIPLAGPSLIQGEVSAAGVVIALALSATIVDATPFSTVGALVVANADAREQQHVYRGMLAWGAVMVLTAPLISWALFVLF